MKTINLLMSGMLVLSLTGCASVEPGERGVKVSLGKVDKDLLQPGLYAINPFFDKVETQSIKQETAAEKCTPLTSDQQQITIEYTVMVKVPEGQILNLYQNYGGQAYGTLVAPQIQEAFRQVVSEYKADAVTKDLGKIRGQVLSLVRENVKGLVDVVDIPITHIEMPKVLQDAIAAKQVMEQQSLQKAYELDKAKREAQITIANAEAKAKEIQLQSDALQKSPELIEYKRIEKWNGVLPQTVLGGNGQSLFVMK